MSFTIRLTPEQQKKFGTDILSYLETNWVNSFVSYCIDSRYRKAVHLESWVNDQVTNPNAQVLEYLESIVGTGVDLHPDKKAEIVLKAIIKDIKYVPEMKAWQTAEKWQTAAETLGRRTGDCEDGAVLMYVLLRLWGVPHHHLWLFAGDVEDKTSKTGDSGHCWLVYKPVEFPINWVFLDWCYWPQKTPIGTRDLYFVDEDNLIFRYQCVGDDYFDAPSTYYNMWFAFNEKTSQLSFKRK
jgi:predicted transglutaminase-like cysteine proteinase